MRTYLRYLAITLGLVLAQGVMIVTLMTPEAAGPAISGWRLTFYLICGALMVVGIGYTLFRWRRYAVTDQDRPTGLLG